MTVRDGVDRVIIVLVSRRSAAVAWTKGGGSQVAAGGSVH